MGFKSGWCLEVVWWSLGGSPVGAVVFSLRFRMVRIALGGLVRVCVVSCLREVSVVDCGEEVVLDLIVYATEKEAPDGSRPIGCCADL